ncbi:MAG: DUF2938 domain-containing protein [Hyphomonadaceae bacterium]|nr:DUF2938 domain-containing protein [Hyphomonadaceae bacterium]
MEETLGLALRIASIGVGATLILDAWSFLLQRTFGAPFPNYTMVGRWIGNFGRGRFAHESMGAAPPVAGERLIGWAAHYAIGILYAALLVGFAGVNWLSAPTLPPALIVGVATVVAPFFVMQPGMGLGVASSKAPNPNVARLRSLAAHAAFGFGLYLTALFVTKI